MLYALITLLYYGILAYQTYKVVFERCLSAESLPGHILLTWNTTWCSVLFSGCVTK